MLLEEVVSELKLEVTLGCLQAFLSDPVLVEPGLRPPWRQTPLSPLTPQLESPHLPHSASSRPLWEPSLVRKILEWKKPRVGTIFDQCKLSLI